jgi:ribulose-phosphate 3-epimerase
MFRCTQLSKFRETVPAVLPSLLSCDFRNLEREVGRLETAGAPALHVDVMDGYFVPNLTFGMPIIRALRRLTDLPLDVHLMIIDPGRYVEDFVACGADILTVHVEATDNPRAVLEEIRVLGAAAGITLNPDTPLSQLEDCLDLCDLVLIMSVEAGFGGQAFNPVALERLQRVREIARPEVLLEVDGGVNEMTIADCAAAGAQLFVVGSALFANDDYGRYMKELTRMAASAPQRGGAAPH